MIAKNRIERRKIWRRLWVLFGSKKQLLKTCEELNELSVSILHFINKAERSGGNLLELKENINEEYADVLNMMEQLENNFEVIDMDLVNKFRQLKTERVRRRYF